MLLKCIHCKKLKKIPQYRIKSFKYCSKNCKHLSMLGSTPWNKNIKYNIETKKKLNMDGLKIGRGYLRGKITKITYKNIHHWVRVNKTYPKSCVDCGVNNKRLEWSNIDHKYRLILNDYVARCKKCHTKYDYINQLSNKGCRWGSIPNKMGGDLL